MKDKGELKPLSRSSLAATKLSGNIGEVPPSVMQQIKRIASVIKKKAISPGEKQASSEEEE